MTISATYSPTSTTVTAVEGSVVTFTIIGATHSGGQAVLYQWQRKDAQGGAFQDISGATSSSYTTPSLLITDSGDQYRCYCYTLANTSTTPTIPADQQVFPSSQGWTLNVQAATILLKQVDLNPTYSTTVGGTLQFELQTTYSGGAADSQTNVNLITYQWQYRTSSTETWTNVTTGTQTGGGTITITNDTTSAQTGSTSVYFRRSILLFQNIPFAQNLYQYRAVITSSIATNSPLNSDTATIVIGATINVTKQPGTSPDITTIYKYNSAQTWSPNGATNLTLTASSTAGSFSTLSYQWYFRLSSADSYSPMNTGSNILFNCVSATTATLELFNVSYLTYFEVLCRVQGSAGEAEVYSSSVIINVRQTVVMTTNPVNSVANDNETVNFFAAVNTNAVTGTAGPVLTKWQRKNPGSSTWFDLTNWVEQPSPSYSTPILSAANDNGAYYRLAVDGENCTNEPFYSPSANGASLTIYSYIIIASDPQQSTVYQNQVASFAVNASTSNNATISYQWQYRTSSTGTWTNLSNNSQYVGVTTNILLIYNTTLDMSGYQYRVILTAPGTISSLTSTSASLLVLEDTFTYIAPINDLDLFQNQALNYTGSATSRSLSAVQYQWQFKYSNISTIIGVDVTITSGQSYSVSGNSYPVRGVLWVPTSLASSNIDVVVCYHPTIENSTTTILDSANTMMNIMKNNVNIKDKIIFCPAYPQDAISVTQNLNLLTAAQLSTFKFGDNLPYARAALLWVKNSLNTFMSSQGITKTIKNVYMFGHSQGGSLVHKLNTLEATSGAIANAPGPIRLDLTCAAAESGSGSLTCSKLFTAYGTATATPLSSNQYFLRSLENYVTGHLAPITYTQALNDTTGYAPGTAGQVAWMTELLSLMQTNNQAYSYTTVPTGGHDSFVTNPVVQTVIRTAVESTTDWVNISGATTTNFSIASVTTNNAGYYRYRVISNGGTVGYSNSAAVTVTPLSISIVNNTGTSVTVLEGQNNAVVLKVTATPTVNASLSYEWQYNTNPTGNTGWAVFPTGYAGSSPTEANYVPLAFARSQNGLRCRCAITADTIPGTFYSSETIINVNRRFTYIPIPVSIIIAANQYDTIDISPVVTGGSPVYQWQYRTSSGGVWTDVSGYTTQTLDILGYSATNQLPAAGSLIVQNGWQIRCLVTLDDATQYQFFSQATGVQTTAISPAGSQFAVNKNASPDLTATVNVVAVAPEYVLYSKQTAKSGAAIGTVMCVPKPDGYVYPGTTGGDDIMLWNRPHPSVSTLGNSEKLKYDRRFVGWIPLGASPLMASGNKVAGAILSANEFPELARIMGGTFGGSISTFVATAGFLPPKTGTDGTGGGISGTFGLPLVCGKHLYGTGNVNNNGASVSVVTRYDAKSVSASLNAVGYVGGEYNYNQSNQLPPASGGIAGSDALNPNTFTLGTYTTTGWGDITVDIPTTYSENIQWQVGPLSEKTFNTPTQHGHFLQSFAACPDGACQKIGYWGEIGGSCGAQKLDPLVGLMIEGIAFVGASQSHSHNLALTDASAEATGLESGGGSAGSPTISGSVNQSATGSFLNGGTLTMSQQSNSLWNSALSFTLQNAERMAITTPIYRLKYYIKAW